MHVNFQVKQHLNKEKTVNMGRELGCTLKQHLFFTISGHVTHQCSVITAGCPVQDICGMACIGMNVGKYQRCK